MFLDMIIIAVNLFFYLALMRLRRRTPLNQREDLDKAIVKFTESTLTPLSRLQRGSIYASVLFPLVCARLLCTRAPKQPEDTISTEYLSRLRDQPHDIPGIPRRHVTAFLIGTLALPYLALQIELGTGNVMENIREMAVLSHELLETSDIDATHFTILIHGVVISKIRPTVPDQPLDEIIEFLRVARERRPDLLEGRMAFAICLVCRYIMTCADRDYEEAASILDGIIAIPPGNSQDESVAKARASATGLVTTLRSEEHTSELQSQ